MKNWTSTLMSTLVLLLLSRGLVHAEDWPGWRGANADGVWNETGILEKFPESGPEISWSVDVGLGYSGPAVAEGKVYLTDYQLASGEVINNPGGRAELDGKERILCLDAKSGKQIWKYEYARRYNISYPSGPRCTPTIANGKVFALGAEGDLLCLEASSGKLLWQVNYPQTFGVETPIWGFSSHPVYEDGVLYCIVGGEGSTAVAFDAENGKVIWKALSAPEPGYCTPVLTVAGGKKQLLIWTPVAMNSLNPQTGEVYWSEPLKPGYGMSIMAPVRSGNYLFASGIGDAGAVFELSETEPTAKVVWRGTGRSALYAANSTPFIEGNTLYGCDCRPGIFRAVDLTTGERLWQSLEPFSLKRPKAHATAFIVKQGSRYVLFNESGELVFANLSRDGYEEISKAKVIEPTGEAFGRDVVWTHPAYADKAAFIRNDKKLIRVNLSAQ